MLVTVVETYGRTFVELGVAEKELTLASMALKQDTNGIDLTIVESARKLEMESATKITTGKILALMLLNGVNYFTQGIDGYSKTIEKTVRLLNNYKPL